MYRIHYTSSPDVIRTSHGGLMSCCEKRCEKGLIQLPMNCERLWVSQISQSYPKVIR